MTRTEPTPRAAEGKPDCGKLKTISPTMDRLLALLQIDIEPIAVCDISPDARYQAGPSSTLIVHHVVHGSVICTIPDHGAFTLKAGSILLIPPGCGQVIAGGPDASIHVNLADVCHKREDGLDHIDASLGTEPGCRMMCGEMRADFAGICGGALGIAHPVAADLSESPLVRLAFRTMFEESVSPSPVSRTLTSALMKTCLAFVIRHHLADTNASTLSGLFHKPWISRAINAVLEAPADHHTVASLADLAGRSRSAFSREFARSVGMPPMDFVNQTRLALARRLLASTGLPINDVAWRVGYASRSHFSRAFRKAFAMDPRTYRRAHGALSEREVE